jgi:hypothetical protein
MGDLVQQGRVGNSQYSTNLRVLQDLRYGWLDIESLTFYTFNVIKLIEGEAKRT